MSRYLIFFLSLIVINLSAQEVLTKPDTIRKLDEVVVHGYASDRNIQEVPAAIGIIKDQDLNRFSPVSILPAVNMIPGVRMEERSPGSYRFSIRGSSLRSPFGVRNVKFYWNGLPLTDGGGNTYLNLFDFSSIGSIEIIKGPGASLYGAGTGGVVLLTSPKDAGLSYSLTGGSYGLFHIQAGGSLVSTEKFQMNMRLSYQQSDGYRQQTKMNRLVAQFDFKNSFSPRSFLSGTILSSQLFYETPGGLTQAQYDTDPQQARPSTSPASPGAVIQKASISNNTIYSGLSFEHEWSDQWSTQIGAFSSFTDFTNPAIRNYEIRREENWGGRTNTKFIFDIASANGRLNFGAEYQHFFSPITDYDNLSGNRGNVQTDDKLRSELVIGFTQIDLDLPANFYLTLGTSINFIKYQFERIAPLPSSFQERNFDPVISPRVALLKKLSESTSIYGSVSSGFSPPTLAEVRPSTATFNSGLNSERGVSYEIGVKTKVMDAFDASFTLYDFILDETIVIQSDATGADFFINAGKTDQKGAEIFLSWSKQFDKVQHNTFINNIRLYTSLSYNHYRFNNYITSGNDFSGNALTGVAPYIVTFGSDIIFKKNFYLNITSHYVDRIPLNDANTDYASQYFLLGAKFGYKLTGKLPLEFFLGIENALDERYSLGNDLNAVGGRYFNASSRRNYFGGIALRLKSQKSE
ncbi:MAG: TonB-dependent receptor plug domain-containing protein [Cyclobacteriaceae bacterium]|nr:TonB-dependent receptor plug domain-containing protein [Cyclobacteriaceae bacterium]